LSLHLGFRPKFSILKECGELSRNFKTFFLWEPGFEGRDPKILYVLDGLM
jgi:hypothetical protein